MKKIISVLAATLFSTLLLFAPVQVLAQVTTDELIFEKNCEGNANTTFCKDQTSERVKGNRVMGPNGIATRVTQVIVFITAAVSVIMVVIGGFKYVVSGGDSNGIQSAKNTILYALIGLVVAIFAQVIVSFVLARL